MMPLWLSLIHILIENVLNGYGTVAYSVCDKMPWYNEDAVTEYDLDAAKALMEEAGWIEGDDGIRDVYKIQISTES